MSRSCTGKHPGKLGAKVRRKLDSHVGTYLTSIDSPMTEQSGVKVGAILCGVNDIDVSKISFEGVLKVIVEVKRPLTELRR